MAQFIDRRLNGKNKSTVNRQRFLRRYKEQIKESVADAVNRRSITNTESGEDVSIPTRDIKEPMFHQGKGGVRERVHPGNDQFIRGDKIDRPKGGQGSGGSGEGEASADGEGSDDFVFQISKDEYLDILFEDLALPNLKKNQVNKITEWKTHRAGFQTSGVPSNISVVRSLQQSLARRTAMTAGKRRLMSELEEENSNVFSAANHHKSWKRCASSKRLKSYAIKSIACPLSTPLICASKTTKSARFPPVRR